MTDNDGVSLCYWVDVTSWWEQLKTIDGLSLDAGKYDWGFTIGENNIIKQEINIVQMCNGLGFVCTFICRLATRAGFSRLDWSWNLNRIYSHRNASLSSVQDPCIIHIIWHFDINYWLIFLLLWFKYYLKKLSFTKSTNLMMSSWIFSRINATQTLVWGDYSQSSSGEGWFQSENGMWAKI